MAKKFGFENEEAKYDMDFDDGLASFDADVAKKKGARAAVTDFGHGFLEGASDQLFDPHFIKRLARNNVPSVFGQVMDFADEGARTISDTLRDAKKDMDPAIQDFQRTIRRYTPQVKKYMPEFLAKRVIAFGGSAGEAGMSKEDMLTAQINQELNTTLGQGFQAQAQQAARDEARDMVKQGIETERFKGMFTQMNQVRMAVEKTSQYLSDVDFKYKRKSLELQYRQMYLMKELVEESRKQTAMNLAAFKDLVKNTGLPDYAKLTTQENIKQVLKNKYIGSVNLIGLAKRSQFLRDVSTEIRKIVGDRVRNFADALRTGVSTGEQVVDTVGMMNEMGGGVGNLAGQMIGGQIAEHYGTKLGSGIRNLAIKHAPQWLKDRAGKYGNRASYTLNNLPQGARQWAMSNNMLPYLGKVPVLGELLTGIAQEAVMRATTPPAFKMQGDTIANLQAPSTWSNQNNRSLNTVIPGYMARILRSIDMLRTGNEKTPLVIYDQQRGVFSDHGSIREGIFKKVVAEDNRTTLHRDINEMLKEIDPKNELSKTDRDALRKQIILDNIRNGGAGSYGTQSAGYAERYFDARNYRGMKLSQAERLSEHFKGRYSDQHDPLYKNRQRFSQLNSQMGGSTRLDAAYLQSLVNAGHGDILHEIGLMDDYGYIDEEKYFEYLIDGIPKNAKSKIQDVKRRRTRRLNLRPNHGGSGRRDTGGSSPHVPSGPHSPFDHGGGGSNQMDPTALIAAIQANSVKDLTRSMEDHIKNIRMQLEFGVRTFPMTGEGGELPFMDRSLRQHMTAAGAGARGLWGKAKAWWDEDGFFTEQWGKRKGYMQAASKFIKGTTKRVRQAWDDITAVYVGDEENPRLTAWGLRHGMYYDQFGKVIQNWRDIKGAVFDERGSPIVTLDEMKLARAKSAITQKTIQFYNFLKEKGAKLWEDAKNITKNTYLKTVATAKDLYKKAENYLDAQDVYTKIDMSKPKLYATIMRNGGYRSFHHPDKPVKSPKDIDGPVINLNGTQELTDDDIRAGLCDQFGRPLVTGKLRMIQLGKDLVTKMKHNVSMGLKAAKDFMTGKWKGFKDWFQLDGVLVTGGKLIVDRLTEIRDLLIAQFGNRRKSTLDRDGDGYRDGSFEEMKHKGALHERVGQSKEWANQQFEKIKDQIPGAKERLAHGGGILSQVVGKLKTKFLGRFGLRGDRSPEEILQHMDETLADMDQKMDNGGGLGDSGGGGSEGGGTDESGKKPGRWQRFKQGAKDRWGKFRSRGVKETAKDALSAAREKMSKESLKASAKQVAEKLSPRSLARGGAELAGRAASSGTKLLGGGLWGLAKAALPFLADMSAVAGAAQIGASVLGGIAAIITSPVVLTGLAIGAGVAGAGYGIYKGAKFLMRQKLTELSKLRFMQYGFDPVKDEGRASALFEVENLLEPHIQYTGPTPSIDARGLNQKKVVELFGVDLNDKRALERWAKWFNNRFKPVYLVQMAALHAISPKTKLAGIEDLHPSDKLRFLDIAKYPSGPYDVLISPFDDDPLTVTSKPITAYAEQLVAKFKAEVKKNPASDEHLKTGESGDKNVALTTMTQLKYDNVRNAAGMLSEGQKAKYALMMDPLHKDKTQTAVASTGTVMTVEGAFHAGQLAIGTKLDALTSVRLKTYGLREMSVSKVRALLQLEMEVIDDITLTPKGTTVWKGDPRKVLSGISAAFGFSNNTASMVGPWYTWFNQRFLPVFLNYYAAMKKFRAGNDLKAAALALKPEDMLTVIDAIKTSKSLETGKSVWDIKASPWPDYDMNDDVKSIDENIAAINSVEQKGTYDQVTGLYKDNDGQKKATGLNGWLNKITDTLGLKRTRNLDGSYSMLGLRVNARSDDPNRTTGVQNAIDTSMTGKGGDVSKMQGPKGASGYDAMKDLITDAASIVGIDPKLLLTIAAIESGFNPNAKAGTSSAKGLFQFIDSTWKATLAKHGKQFGLGMDASALDPKANALMGAAFLKDNVDAMKKYLQRPITPTDVYISHFLGDGGAKTLLQADPSKAAADVMPAAAKANKNLFYQKDGSKVTVAQFYQTIQNLVQKRSGQYNIGLTGGSSVTADASGANTVKKDAKTDGNANSNATSKVVSGGPVQQAQTLTGMGAPVTAAALGNAPTTVFNTNGAPNTSPAKSPSGPASSATSNAGMMGPPSSAMPGSASPLQLMSPKPVPNKAVDSVAMGTALTAKATADIASQTKQQTTVFTQGLDLHQTSNDHLSSIDQSTATTATLLKTILDVLNAIQAAASHPVAAPTSNPAPLDGNKPPVTKPTSRINLGKVSFMV